VGCSLSLVASHEDKIHSLIVKKLGVQFEKVVMDGRLMSGAQERVNMATKVVTAQDIEGRSQRQNQWFKEKADEIGLELDDDMLDNGLAGGDQRDQCRLSQAKKAKSQLQKLLREPLVTQRFGKFLATNSAARQNLLGSNIVTSNSKPKSKRPRK
jgi:hypothetical protein